MADTGRTVWADGLWADDFWASGLWAADEAVLVPDVVGELQADGISTLEGAGFVVVVVEAYSSVVPRGTIISQEPVGGSSASPGSTVTITVSLGEAVQALESTGGWYGDWRSVQELRRRRKKRQEEIEQELKELAEDVVEGKLSQVDHEIAEFLRVQEGKDIARAERERLRKVAESARNAEISERVQQAAAKAVEQATYKNLARFEQELKRHMETEELSILIMLLMDDL